MNYYFSPQSSIAPSATLAVHSRAAALRSEGVPVYNLSVGEAHIPTHASILEAAKQALDADRTKYCPEAGIPELRAAWRAWMLEAYLSEYADAETTITAGGKHAIQLLLQTLVSPGDEVLFAAPYWVSYPSMVQVAGGVSKIIETKEDDGWKLTATALEEHITQYSRVLILNSAANPTGVVYTADELEAVLAVAAAYQLTVISDEVYSTLVYDGAYISCASFPMYRDRLCIVQSVSKHFAMTGWRVGVVFAPMAVTTRVRALQGQSTSGAASISQYAAVGAVLSAHEISTSIRDELQVRRDSMVSTFASYGVHMSPVSSGLYQFVPMSLFQAAVEERSADWCLRMLNERGVAMVPGSAFGAEGYVRLSFGGSIEDTTAAIRALCT